MDVLGAIYEARGKRKPPRASADRSIRTTGHLLDYDAGSWLATVSVHNSAPISGVPATPADYVGLGITTVSVLLDPETGRPVQVLGPASDVAVGGAGGIAPPPGAGGTRIVRGRVFLPVDTGTWDTDAESWDTISTYGGVTDARQEASAPGNLILNPDPTAEPSEPESTWGYITGTGWSTSHAVVIDSISLAFGPAGVDDTSFEGRSASGNSSPLKMWHTDGPSGDVPAPAVTPASDYALSSLVAHGSNHGTWAMGVDWYDAEGDVLSTSIGDAEAPSWSSEPPWPDGPYYVAAPTATLTAPEGATHGRPFTYWNRSSTTAHWFFCADASMAVDA